ncbi:MAG TPA: DUF4097 family beta strand repeat-containing protein [Terriglobales bacterium]|nr:DUF4097 family beta strand repeat-containing protein [Terriglobales bacterium]
MRSKILCAWLIVIGTAVGVQAEEWTKTYSVTGKPEVRVTLDDGAIHVSTSNEGGVKATVSTCGWRIGPHDVRVEENQSGNRIEIAVKVPPGPHIVMGCKNVKVELTVPSQSDVDLHSKDGSIVADGLKGTERLSTGDGRIDARAMDGVLNADTRDGNVNVDGRFDILTVHTGDGRIDAITRPGSRLNGAWSLMTRDGSVHVRLPADIAAELDARTGDGSINCEFPLGVSSSGDEDSHAVRGKLNGGGPMLEIRTLDGRIDVLKE